MSRSNPDQSERTGYRDVRAEILRRIRDKTWQAGVLMPTETDLAAELGCARATVNRAMRELAEEGVLDRKRKAGTRVAAAPVRRAQLKIPLVRAEIEATGASYSYTRLSHQVCDAVTILKDYDCKGLAVHVRCLHFANETPFQLEERWISLAGVPGAKAETFGAVSPNEWLISEVPFTDVEISFSAKAATSDVAENLSTDLSAPIFVTERATWATGVFITYARLSHPETYSVTTRY